MNRFSHPELLLRQPAVNARTGRGVTAVLGPTNTGKTHLAIERMLAQPSGMIGLPLRLLAREIYARIVDRIGADAVSLVTGEEKILPAKARYLVCTVEAMPLSADMDFVAIDEVQLAADLTRGHVFTDRLMNLRGAHETMLLGAATLRPALESLLPGINIVTRPRMSQLTYAGQKKVTRLPRRSAIVAFNADEVYAIAELIRRQRGAAAVVLGSLSPRTRNAQVALYQSGDVDYLVATDAIGMGLNLDVDHVAFAQQEKFDGLHRRRLKPSEFAQIAGRAGRHTQDGTFGVTGQADPFEDELIQRLEAHEFQPEKLLQWRNRDLDFASVEALLASLDHLPKSQTLVKGPMATDHRALVHMNSAIDIRKRAQGRQQVELLWQVAQIPDYRKIAPANHADMLATIFRDLTDDGHIDEDWFANQVRQTNLPDGDIDALSNRIAHIRTWTFVSHRDGWLRDSTHWQDETRKIENRLSDALHERLTKRFVDRRTSVLMKRLRENTMLEAEIAANGAVTVEGHHVGELSGFRFTADPTADGEDARAMKAAAQKALASEIEARSQRLAAAPNADIVLDNDGTLRWVGAPVGKLVVGEQALSPRIVLLADEQLTGPARDRVAARLERWLGHHIETLLKPLQDLATADGLEGLPRGVAFRLVEEFGCIDRREIAEDIRGLDQDQRGALRRLGVRFGAYHIFIPALLKPAPAALVSLLWSLANDALDMEGRAQINAALASGRTSVSVEPTFEPRFYRLAGYRQLGARAVRLDILERLADLIRPAMGWRLSADKPQKRPEGAWDGGGFMVTTDMLSILGASHEDMGDVLRGLGYRCESMKAEQVTAKLAQWDGTSPPHNAGEKSADSPSENGSSKATQPEEVTETTDMSPVEKAERTPEAEPVEEPKSIDIWRSAGRGSARPRRRGAGRGRDAPKGKPGHGGKKHTASKGAKGRDGSNAGKASNAPKAVDPDSPFAKLAALKTSLTKGGEKPERSKTRE
ncbi:MAG: helicase-related protein [Ahrensia sp.]|nr:helicase-related protein [Ahrensia sp.]